MHVEYIDANKLLFHFSEKDKGKILTNTPWIIQGHPLIPREWPQKSTLNKLNFSSISYWIQLHSLPCEKMTTENVLMLGSCLGTALEVDESSDPLGLLCKPYLRVLVEIKFDHPLKPGFLLLRDEKLPVWISFKYERLSDFCLKWARLDYASNSMNEAFPISDGEIGSWLRAEGPGSKLHPLRSHHTSHKPSHPTKLPCPN